MPDHWQNSWILSRRVCMSSIVSVVSATSSAKAAWLCFTPHACWKPAPAVDRCRRQRLMKKTNRDGERQSPCWVPLVTSILAVSPNGVLTFTHEPACACRMVSMSSGFMPIASRL
eukprot:31823-Rhodomonas_salina.3